MKVLTFNNCILLLTTFLLTNLTCFSQVGIGTSEVDPSAILEVKSNSKGFIPPRLADPFVIDAPQTGLTIYNTTERCIQMNTGTPQLPLWTCIGQSKVAQNFTLKETIGTTALTVAANTKVLVPNLSRTITVPTGGKRYFLVNANIPVNTTGPSSGVLELNGVAVASHSAEASKINNHIKMIDLVTYLELDEGTHTLEVHILAGDNGVSVNLPNTDASVAPVNPIGETIIGKAELITLESSTSLGVFTTEVGTTETTINAGTEMVIPGLTNTLTVPAGKTHYVTINVDIPILDTDMSTVILNVDGTPVIARTGNSSLVNNKVKSVSFQKYLELEGGNHTITVSVFAGASNATVNMENTHALVASLVPTGLANFGKGKLQVLNNNLSWTSFTEVKGTTEITIPANTALPIPGLQHTFEVEPGDSANLMIIIDIPVTSATPSTGFLVVNNAFIAETGTDEAQEDNNSIHSINFKRGAVLPPGTYTLDVRLLAGENNVKVNAADTDPSVVPVKPSGLSNMGKATMQILYY
ncbi:MAG: hypothetical protein ACPGSD_05345 [Flavobacteriales bacterium]